MLSICWRYLSLFLILGHVSLLTLSNVLVQYPFELFGLHTTWGALTYPVIFILTDLTIRLSNAAKARRIIMYSMLPGLILSYVIAVYFDTSSTHIFSTVYFMPLRIAAACFIAYVVGQLLDIFVFQRYRTQNRWWLAPICSSTIGNIVDTILFFSIAFYHCSNPFLSEHWLDIALVDLVFKITISWLALVPLYGVVLNYTTDKAFA